MNKKLIPGRDINRKSKLFGRPALPENEKRNIKIAVFFSNVEAGIIKEKCDKASLSAPEFVRRTSLARHVESRPSTFDSEALTLLRRCCGDISKIKRDIASAREYDLEIDLDHIERKLENQLSILRRMNRLIIEK